MAKTKTSTSRSRSPKRSGRTRARATRPLRRSKSTKAKRPARRRKQSTRPSARKRKRLMAGRVRPSAADPEIEAELWQVAEAHAKHRGYEFAPNCEADLKQTIRRALEKDVNQTVRYALSEAEANTRRLVDEMVAVAEAEGFPQLYEETLRQALRRLCPLFPFC
jgi:hypothetical protein